MDQYGGSTATTENICRHYLFFFLFFFFFIFLFIVISYSSLKTNTITPLLTMLLILKCSLLCLCGTGGGVLPYKGYIGTCRGIGYGFGGSQSLNRVSFFDPFVTVFLVWSFDRVAKLYYLILE